MKKYEVICPHCCGSFHETTEAFVADAPAKGNMFRLKQHYVDCGWSAFPPYPDTQYDNLTCPACDQPYVDSRGYVLRLVEVGEYPDQVVDSELEEESERLISSWRSAVNATGDTESMIVHHFNATMSRAEKMTETLIGNDGAGGLLGDIEASIEQPPTPTTEAHQDESPRKRRGRKVKA